MHLLFWTQIADNIIFPLSPLRESFDTEIWSSFSVTEINLSSKGDIHSLIVWVKYPSRLKNRK